MKTLSWLMMCGAMASLNFAHADTINAPASLIGANTLNGDNAYLWTVASGNLASSGNSVSSVTVSFNNITETLAGNGNDITIDLGSFVNMPVGKSSVPATGQANSFADNDAVGDAFLNNVIAGDAVRLGTMNFPALNTPENLSVTLNPVELADLDTYMNTGAWGLEIDPDCHFNVGSICVTYTTTPNCVPDKTSTIGLLGFCLAGMVIFQQRRVAQN